MITLSEYLDRRGNPVGRGLRSLESGHYMGQVREIVATRNPFSPRSAALKEGGFISELAWSFYEVVEPSKV